MAEMEASEIAEEASTSSTFPFVEVIGPDGKTKRFAKGTRSGFAVERFNKLLPNDMKPVVCIAASKEGEEPIEFGPDVELILYDKAWKLQAISEDVFFKVTETIMETETEVGQTQTVPEDLYTWTSSSQAPWALHEGASKTLLGGATLPNTTPLYGAKSWEDLYPGGKLPEGGKQECTPAYLFKVLMMFVFIFGFAGALGYFLERMPEALSRQPGIQPS
jgi:hypothetical protein